MSPRAACRLETLGFPDVSDYVAGKADWLAHGLPREGEKATERRALDLAADDVVTCGLEDRIGDVRARVAALRHGVAFVVTPDGTATRHIFPSYASTIAWPSGVNAGFGSCPKLQKTKERCIEGVIRGTSHRTLPFC